MAKSLETSRLELQTKLETLLGSRQVYFQPPETVKMKYPAIAYDLYQLNQRFADDTAYRRFPRYTVTIIDRNQEIDWVPAMLDAFQYCSVERIYYADGLAHYAFVIYYL